MSELFLKIVNMSISASYLVAAVLLLRLVLKKAPKWVSVLLWGMVAIRLICPISIESVLSLIPSTQTVSPEIMMDRTPEVSTGIPAVDTVVNPVITETFAPEPIASANPLQILIPVSANLWLLGVLVMLGYTAVSYLMLRHKLATAVRLKNNIYQCENVDSPFVLGMVRPRIYLPFRMDGKNLNHVIAHEEAHIRRKDHWWKPMGFVLLAIHWFNPLMWVGYILLCRDIELACDEKVIKEMDNETKADYMQALVSCSVNRRMIAACPLAFGEVGVKERVKTMMNYKKPAFWIVIAAVALCIVVAVSFLTNPKDYSPEVGNPKMLELPGVEWFVTPEEFKEALNITKKQIISEDINSLPGDTDGSDDTYELSVTDLTLFGKEVHYALFSFDRAPDGEFELVQAVVMFDEDTDMEQLKDNLVEIYGTGSSEPYSYYLYQGNVKQNHIHKSRMEQDLEYRSMNDRFLEGLDGNPFKDALEDPDYMTHHWVTENGCSLIPEEVVEWFKYAMDRPANADEVALQDDEVLMEMLDQLPWVAMTLSNRNAATIQRDAQGTNNESVSYYTNNYIEFNAGWLAQYRHEVRETQMSNPSLLEFPGLKWGMTPEEVKTSLSITDDQIIAEQSSEPSDGYEEKTFAVINMDFFGAKADSLAFRFVKRNGQEFALDGIQLMYADDIDMTVVRDNLVEIYGKGYDRGLPEFSIYNGEIHSHMLNFYDPTPQYGKLVDGQIVYEDRDPSLVRHGWNSTAKGTDVYSQEVIEAIVDYYENPEWDESQWADRDVVLEFLDTNPLVVVKCMVMEGTTGNGEPIRRNMVTFNARYIDIQQKIDSHKS